MRPATMIPKPLHWPLLIIPQLPKAGLTTAPDLGLGGRKIIIQMYMGVGPPLQLLCSLIRRC